jgi:protocatechuate 3,4-dioxygenase, alpha subunit
LTRARTPAQTVGPFFAVGLLWSEGPHVVPVGTPNALWIRGLVLDGDGEPVSDALIETWQADPDGRYRDAHVRAADPDWFRGFGRAPTDPAGAWAILTVKPGPTMGPDGAFQAPHVDVAVFARGLLKRAVTRIYFGDEEDRNEADPVLLSVTDPSARSTLVAERTDDGYRFDIRLQGDGETVFFDV